MGYNAGSYNVGFNNSGSNNHESWQKAFEKASIEEIKELLNLPNFDYEIFERITSITKRQIEEKLGE